jgi:hypothetical protein
MTGKMPVFKPLRKSITVVVPAKLRIGIEKLLFCDYSDFMHLFSISDNILSRSTNER